MQCDHCGGREAEIHFTQIVDNEMTTYHLCEDCAAEKGVTPAAGPESLPLTDFLAQMGKGPSSETLAGSTQCAFCGTRIDDFKKTGRLGCSHCYVTFEPYLRTLLRRLHGGTQHVGKVYLPPNPSDTERKDRLAGLRRRLDKAVAAEDFERAASLRDEIRTLEAVQ